MLSLPASVNKEVLSQIEMLVCHRISAPQDRKALDEWIVQRDTEGRRKEFLEVLSSLARGKAWFWSPALDIFDLVSVRTRETYDCSKTPETGEAPAPPAAWAKVGREVDLAALEALLSSEESTDDAASGGESSSGEPGLGERTRKLQADKKRAEQRIDELERKLAEEKSVSGALLKRVELLETRVREGRRHAGEIVEAFEAILDDASPTKERAGQEVGGTQEEVKTAASAQTPGSGPGSELEHAGHVNERILGRVPAGDSGDASRRLRKGTKKGGGSAGRRPLVVDSLLQAGDAETGLPVPRRRILAALLYVEALGLDELDARDLAEFSGQRPTSSRYEGHLAALRKDSLLEYRANGTRAFTEAGRKVARTLAGDPAAGESRRGLSRWNTPRSLHSLHAAWFALLPDPQVRILCALIERRGSSGEKNEASSRPDEAWVSFDELAELSEQRPTSSRYEGHRAKLRRLGLLEYHEAGGRARATDLLFPESLLRVRDPSSVPV